MPVKVGDIKSATHLLSTHFHRLDVRGIHINRFVEEGKGGNFITNLVNSIFNIFPRLRKVDTSDRAPQDTVSTWGYRDVTLLGWFKGKLREVKEKKNHPAPQLDDLGRLVKWIADYKEQNQLDTKKAFRSAVRSDKDLVTSLESSLGKNYEKMIGGLSDFSRLNPYVNEGNEANSRSKKSRNHGPFYLLDERIGPKYSDGKKHVGEKFNQLNENNFPYASQSESVEFFVGAASHGNRLYHNERKQTARDKLIQKLLERRKSLSKPDVRDALQDYFGELLVPSFNKFAKDYPNRDLPKNEVVYLYSVLFQNALLKHSFGSVKDLSKFLKDSLPLPVSVEPREYHSKTSVRNDEPRSFHARVNEEIIAARNALKALPASEQKTESCIGYDLEKPDALEELPEYVRGARGSGVGMVNIMQDVQEKGSDGYVSKTSILTKREQVSQNSVKKQCVLTLPTRRQDAIDHLVKNLSENKKNLPLYCIFLKMQKTGEVQSPHFVLYQQERTLNDAGVEKSSYVEVSQENVQDILPLDESSIIPASDGSIEIVDVWGLETAQKILKHVIKDTETNLSEFAFLRAIPSGGFDAYAVEMFEKLETPEDRHVVKEPFIGKKPVKLCNSNVVGDPNEPTLGGGDGSSNSVESDADGKFTELYGQMKDLLKDKIVTNNVEMYPHIIPESKHAKLQMQPAGAKMQFYLSRKHLSVSYDYLEAVGKHIDELNGKIVRLKDEARSIPFAVKGNHKWPAGIYSLIKNKIEEYVSFDEDVKLYRQLSVYQKFTELGFAKGQLVLSWYESLSQEDKSTLFTTNERVTDQKKFEVMKKVFKEARSINYFNSLVFIQSQLPKSEGELANCEKVKEQTLESIKKVEKEHEVLKQVFANILLKKSRENSQQEEKDDSDELTEKIQKKNAAADENSGVYLNGDGGDDSDDDE